MNRFALNTNIVSAHLRGDVEVGAMIKAITLLYLPITVLGEHFYVTNSLSQLSQSVVESG